MLIDLFKSQGRLQLQHCANGSTGEHGESVLVYVVMANKSDIDVVSEACQAKVYVVLGMTVTINHVPIQLATLVLIGLVGLNGLLVRLLAELVIDASNEAVMAKTSQKATTAKATTTSRNHV